MNGTASFTISGLNPGVHTITAFYPGDSNFAAHAGTPLLLVLTTPLNSPTTTTLTSSSNPSVYGQTATLTATVTTTGNAGLGGTVTFTDGSNTLGTGNLINGVAVLSTLFTTVGTHSITASYSGDAHSQASSGSVNIIVTQDASNTSIGSLTNPSSYGQVVVFSAAVAAASPGSGTPTGSITFYDGATALGSTTLSGGTASLSVATLTAGANSITAAYSGDTNFQANTSGPLSQVVNLAPTTAAVTSSVEPAQINQPVTYTISIFSPYNNPLSGTITLKDGTKTLGTLNVLQPTYSTTYTATGKHSITAIYSGDANDQGSTSAVYTQYVENLPVVSTTKMTSSGSPSLVNSAVMFTATVTSTYGAIPDGETVAFYDGSTQIGTGTTASGVAIFTTSALSVKAHTIKGMYTGDATFKTSAGEVQQIIEAYSTATVVSSAPNPSSYGQAIVLTAVVTTSGSSVPTGNVTFKNGTTSLGTGALNASGIATISTTKLSVGSDSLTASYNGDSLNGKSTSSVVAQTISPAQLMMTLTSSPNPSTAGKSVKFIAMLASNGSLPNGQQVTFSYNGTMIGTAIISAGKATLSTTALPSGGDVVTASYAGGADYSPASASITQIVN